MTHEESHGWVAWCMSIARDSRTQFFVDGLVSFGFIVRFGIRIYSIQRCRNDIGESFQLFSACSDPSKTGAIRRHRRSAFGGLQATGHGGGGHEGSPGIRGCTSVYWPHPARVARGVGGCRGGVEKGRRQVGVVVRWCQLLKNTEYPPSWRIAPHVRLRDHHLACTTKSLGACKKHYFLKQKHPNQRSRKRLHTLTL